MQSWKLQDRHTGTFQMNLSEHSPVHQLFFADPTVIWNVSFYLNLMQNSASLLN